MTEQFPTTSPPTRTARQEEWVGTMRGAIAAEDLVLAHRDAPPPMVGARPVWRAEREALDAEILSKGATLGLGGGTRSIAEEADEFRTCFERDRDRILHSPAFRRLAGKTQVFVFPDDHQRTRLTHALEVAQVATAMSRALGLNVALTEAIALGHDCGHGPGGHASEDAFADFIPGGYDHALYGADVVLAEFNLCAETLDGIRHHSWRLPTPVTPEGAVVSIGDRLAYVAHDADDAIRSGILRPSDLPAIVQERLGMKQSDHIAALINGTIDAIAQTGEVGIVEDIAQALDAFRTFNYERIYHRPAAVRQADRVISMIRALVEHYADAPGKMPPVADGEWTGALSGSPEAYDQAVRWVSGMTDRYAIAAATAIGYNPDQLPQAV